METIYRRPTQRERFFAAKGSVERIRHIFGFGLISAVTNSVIGVLMTLLTWQVFPTVFHGVWVSALAIMVGYFYISGRRKNELRIMHISNRTRLRIARFSGLIGAVWLPHSLVVAMYLSGVEQAAAICLLWVLNLGALAVFGALPFAVLSFSTASLLPLVIGCVMMGTIGPLTLAVATLLLFVTLMVFSLNASAMAFEIEERARQSQNEMRLLTLAHEENRRLVREDQLTGLLNRRAFLAAADTASRESGRMALFMIDLDHFKPINDGLGHEIGDRYLEHVGAVLKRICKGRAIPARLGGDEFAVLTERPMTTDEIETFGMQLLDALRGPVRVAGQSLHVSASIGAALSSGWDLETRDWLRYADQALITAKQSQRGSLRFFSARDYERIRLRSDLSAELEHAIREQQLHMVYQPQVDLHTGELRGFEALARWTDSSSRPVPPPEFIELAEERGIVLDLCDAILSRIAQDVGEWRARGHSVPELSINIHRAQLHHMDRLRVGLDQIRDATSPETRLMLEITEDNIIGRGVESIPERLASLRRDGYRISLDDFGTGYASLTHIRDLEIDQVKIDRAFVADLTENAHDEEIVRSILTIAKSFGLQVVAEGIETPLHHQRLRAMGCNTGQGYLYSKGVPAYKVPAILGDPRRMQFLEGTASRPA